MNSANSFFFTTAEVVTTCPIEIIDLGHQFAVAPNFKPNYCDLNKYVKYKCNFAEAIYNDMISKRYGINVCCVDDIAWDTLKNNLIELDVLEDKNLCTPPTPPVTCCEPTLVTAVLEILEPPISECDV